MNNQDRKQLERAISLIDEAMGIIGSIQESEQEKYDNIPESLQETDKSMQFCERADTLSDVCDSLQEQIDSVGYAMERK